MDGFRAAVQSARAGNDEAVKQVLFRISFGYWFCALVALTARWALNLVHFLVFWISGLGFWFLVADLTSVVCFCRT